MDNYFLAGIAVTILASLMAANFRQEKVRTTLSSYYLARGKLSRWDIGNLLGASSMSLNGIFYHSWLGYKIGVYSILVQVFWVASFLFFILFADRFINLLRSDSLFGNIEKFFGKKASILSAIGVSLTMIALIGWEISIASRIIGEFTEAAVSGFVVVGTLILTVAAYTVRGGMAANRRANILQNWAKLFLFVVILGFSALLLSDPELYIGGAGFELNPAPDYFKFSPLEALIALGGFAALTCNLLFSFVWQPGEATAWQNFSAGANDGSSGTKELRLSTMQAMIRVFIFPGIAGTFLGISLASVAGLTDQNLMATLMQIYASLPYGEWIVFALAIFLTASMLSTVDGLLLGVSYTATRDIFSTANFDGLLAQDGKEPTPAELQSESSVLAKGKAFVILAAVLSGFIYFLIDSEIVTDFQIVYLLVVGQLAVSPLAIHMFISDTRFEETGWIPVGLGLFVGFSLAALGLLGWPNGGMVFVSEEPWIGGVPFLILASPAALVVSFVAILAFRWKNA